MMSWQDYISQFLSFHIVIVYQVLCWPWWVDVCIQQNWFELVTAADNAVQFSWINSSKPSFALHLENHSSASSALHVCLCPLWLSDHIQIFREYLPFVLHDLFTLLHCQKITASHGFVKCLSKLPKQSEISFGKMHRILHTPEITHLISSLSCFTFWHARYTKREQAIFTEGLLCVFCDMLILIL